MHMRTKIYLALAVCVCAMNVHAQSRDTSDPLAAHIGVIARATGDSVILRWGPSNAALWRGANDVGYIVERVEAGRVTALTQQPITPWPKERWAQMFQSRDDASFSKDGTIDYSSVAYTLLYDAPNANIALQNGAEDAKEVQEKQSSLEMSRSFALMAADRDAVAAEALGLRFVDRNVKPGATYVYRVRLAAPIAPYHADTGSVMVVNARRSPSHVAVRAIEGDGRIALAWPRIKEYNMFFVDRSDDGGKSFTRLTKLPQVTVFAGKPSDSEGYGDTTAINYKSYVYRVYGTTSFADMEALTDVHAMAHDVTPPGEPLLYQPKQTGDHAMELKWEMHSPVASDLTGFRIFRGTTDSTATTPVTDVLPASARTFTDTHFSDTLNNYYRIEAYDTARNVSRSFAVYAPLIDSIPPIAPSWLSGTMDTNGIVTLKLKGNTERDLMGYRLLKANAADHEFSAYYESYADPDAPEARRSTYFDTVTIRSLTKYVYYKAIALDRNYNESPLSQVIAVPRPDRVAPVAPVITDVTPTDSNVWIAFIPSSSDDVQKQLLLRREEGSSEWKTAIELTATDKLEQDRNVTANTVYEYTMQAVDSAGNHSKLSGIVTARPYANSTITAVHDLSAALRDDQNAITLMWTNPPGASRVILYRGEADKPVQQYAQIPSGESRFLDSNIVKGGRYTYAVKVFGSNGAESAMSNRVVMEVR
jgi:uncharacterized protein